MPIVLYHELTGLGNLPQWNPEGAIRTGTNTKDALVLHLEIAAFHHFRNSLLSLYTKYF